MSDKYFWQRYIVGGISGIFVSAAMLKYIA